jgi:hypothetical protein
MVWPLENLKKDIVYIVEGEKDCMTMLSAGFNAVTFTGGAGSIPKSYLKFFAGREVVIIYDIDEAGRKGAVNLANALTRISLSTRIVDLPPGELPPKGDLTNFYEKLGDQFADRVRALVAHSDNYVSVATSRVLIPEDIEETYLEDIVKRKLFYRRVRMKVRVVNNAQNETFVIPRDVCLQCNRDWKANICEACPLFYEKEGINMVIKPEYPEILTMIDNDLKKQKEALRSLCNIAEKCPRLKVEYRAFQALYPIVIIPAIEADKPSHNYSLVGAYALDVPSQENEDYLVEAVVLASPETQGLSIVCYKMERDNASLDDFELSDEMKNRLKIFQAKDEECVDQPLQQSTQN